MAKRKPNKAQPEKKSVQKSSDEKPISPAVQNGAAQKAAPPPEITKAPAAQDQPDDEVPLTDGDWTTTENVYERIEEKKAEASRPVRTRVIQAPSRKDMPSEDIPEVQEETTDSTTHHHGPPVTAEEEQRRLAAESLLDRDLSSAKRKRTAEEEAEIKRWQDMQKREAERVAKLQANKEHREQLKQQAKEREEAARLRDKEEKPQGGSITHVSETGTVSHGTSKDSGNTADKLFNSGMKQLSAGRAIFIVIVFLGLSYLGLYIYTRHLNESFYNDLSQQLTGENRLVTEKSFPYTLPAGAALSLEQKKEIVLTPWLADTDKDGLTDDNELNLGTNPVIADTDEDGIPDGLEVTAGLDPLAVSTNGILPDGEIRGDEVLSSDNVTVEITGIPKPCMSTLEPVGNNSINGSPGLVCNAAEFYTDKDFKDAVISFRYPENIISMHGYNENALSVFRFDSENLEFLPVPSTLDTEQKTVSAHIKETGIYAAADTSVLMQEGKTQIFFLIDNSGSMYPEELCAGSEENDLEFKRLDLTLNLIDMFGDTAYYGAGEFSGGYTNIVPISNDTEKVKQKIDAIRTRTNNNFTGTEISNAMEHAIKEFGSINNADKNYIVLLTDGMNTTSNPARDGSVIAAAQTSGITVFTIGLGKDVDSDYLYNIATQTNGQFFQATNADALENIYKKIENFMYFNQITLEEESGRKGYIIADSGFNVTRDGIGYNNFRSDFAPNGADPGIAGLIDDYFTGKLAVSAEGYTTKDGIQVPGYDISGIAELADGKVDLHSVSVGVLDRYNQYLAIKKKWGFTKVNYAGTLPYTESTRQFIDQAGLKVATSAFDFKPPVETDTEIFLKHITFNDIKSFSRYESVLIDSTLCTGNDAQIMNMIRWYYYLPYSDKCDIYDFGYQGDMAFDSLVTELTTGKPAMLIYNGSALNAVRLTKDTSDPNLYVLDTYDSNSPERSTKIELRRTPLYHTSSSYQYAASKNGQEAPLLIVVS
ncbi:MAG: VWA domain-containing protein [Oscillospiraceae bacterium]|nr:VWA domain-containing protein [Oscillospiraceae bacterium]